FAQFFLPNLLLEGVANGEFHITDPLQALNISGNLTATQLRINDDSIGTVIASSVYDKKKQSIQWDLHKTDNPEEGFKMGGTIGIGTNQTLAATFNLQKTNIG